MTFTEAENLIKENKHNLDSATLKVNPHHYILGCIISTTNRLRDQEQFIATECIDNNKNIKEVLLDLNLLSEDLTPFVVVQMWGDPVLIRLESYNSSPLGKVS